MLEGGRAAHNTQNVLLTSITMRTCIFESAHQQLRVHFVPSTHAIALRQRARFLRAMYLHMSDGRCCMLDMQARGTQTTSATRLSIRLKLGTPCTLVLRTCCRAKRHALALNHGPACQDSSSYHNKKLGWAAAALSHAAALRAQGHKRALDPPKHVRSLPSARLG